MNLTLTQLSTIKNPYLKSTINTVLQVVCLLSVALFSSLPAQAQTNNCPEGDPLELDWIQNLLTNNNCEDRLIKNINQFEYNGNDYFYTYQNYCIYYGEAYPSDGDVTTYYDCQGNVVCYSWSFFYSSCDQEIFNASLNSTNIWRYEYSFTNPFETTIVQNAMEDDCTDAIYAFDYEGEPYIYFKYGCNYFDEIYACKTQFSCSTVSGNIDGSCDILIDAVEPLLNEDNAIWTNPCTYDLTGIVEDSSCGLYIACCLDLQMEPLILPEGFTLQEGQNVEFSVNDLNTGEWCLPLGVQIEITCIRKVADNCGCSSSSTYPVCGVDGNTYHNACLATCNGVEVDYNGDCIPCYANEPLQAGWIKELIANDEGCAVDEIQQFEYNGATHFVVHPYNGGAGFARNGEDCLIDAGFTYYDCIGNIVCYLDADSTCDFELLDAANSATTVWTYNETGCANPLETEFVQQWINNGCAAESIYSFELEGETFIYVKQNFDCDIFFNNYNSDNAEWNNLYNCNTGIACIPFHHKDDQNCFNLSDSFYDENINEDNLIWTKPCAYELTGEVIQASDLADYNGIYDDYYDCDLAIQFTITDQQYGNFYYGICAQNLPDGFILYEGQIVELTYRSSNTGAEIICIRAANQGNQMKCPENNTTSVCAPVNIPPSLTLQNFSTTNDTNYINTMSMQMEEQTDVQKYFNTTTRVYIISDESGNQKTCETKHHIANQFLQMPEVAQPGAICEEDLWSYVKIGTAQYMLYDDQNGAKGTMMSTCNTPGLICSTSNLGVDTKVSNTYNFWASTYFEFPDGTVCESEAMPFYLEVQAKPVAELSQQNKTVNIGEGIALMDMVTTNTSGYWTGENIIYLMTATGENIAYFSDNNPGINKLYYTVSNGFCERSYLLIVEVDGTSGKTENVVDANEQHLLSFNIYPNPATNKVYVDLPYSANNQISLMDISGKIMKQIELELNTSAVEMNVSDLPKGMYLVELKNDYSSNIQKLIIE